MFRFVLAIAALLLSFQAQASVVGLPTNGSVEISGPFTTDPLWGPQPIFVQLFFSGGPAVSSPDNAWVAWRTSSTISTSQSSLSLVYCGSSFGGPCLSPWESNHGYLEVYAASNKLTIDSHAGLSLIEDKTTLSVSYWDVPYSFILTAELPDGFSILAPGVPEPSTWAMMLIGFAGICLLGRRRVPAPARSGTIAKPPQPCECS
ncbi:PEPxxWA-CTERM sorting domain-containing protein [Bradyrhizobium sp. HKCCYLS3077]|uniref:PEPxxWA-CTERM sorting domain-containing protein n=1 Tax=Bradyrhizobium sp. HKCCYLS3077 TaxID=3420761 RepID=UPI003EB98209